MQTMSSESTKSKVVKRTTEMEMEAMIVAKYADIAAVRCTGGLGAFLRGPELARGLGQQVARAGQTRAWFSTKTK